MTTIVSRDVRDVTSRRLAAGRQVAGRERLTGLIAGGRARTLHLIAVMTSRPCTEVLYTMTSSSNRSSDPIKTTTAAAASAKLHASNLTYLLSAAV